MLGSVSVGELQIGIFPGKSTGAPDIMDTDLHHSFRTAPARHPAQAADLGRVLAILILFVGIGLAAAHVPGGAGATLWDGTIGATDWHGNVARAAR